MERNFINFVITELDDGTFSNVLNSGEPVAEYYRNRWWLPLLKLKNENKLPRYEEWLKDFLAARFDRENPEEMSGVHL